MDILILILISFLNLLSIAQTQVCEIQLDRYRREPLFLEGDGKTQFRFVEPFEGKITIQNGASVHVSCTDSRENDSKWLKTIKCENERLRITSNHFSQIITWQSLECEFVNIPRVKEVKESETKRFCPRNLKSMGIGFEIPGKKRSLALLIALCYNDTTASTQLSRHYIYGGSISAKMPGNENRFRTDEINERIQLVINKCYKKAAQEIRFSNRYINEGERFFARSHLAPDADSISASWRDATYFYINTVPVWQKVNNGIWTSVENIIRKIAHKVHTIVTVYTGVYQNQTLNGKSTFCQHDPAGPYTDTYKGVEIPKWIFKAVIVTTESPQATRGIAFFTLNDIYATSVPNPLPCEDKCEFTKWLPITRDKNRKSLEKGYTICCSIQDANRTVPFIFERYNINLLKAGDF